jgi:hypothetical protein
LGKITISLDNEIERKLRMYVARNYPLETYGKMSQVVNEALEEFFKNKE